jgi:hypothetical protein
LIEWRKRRVGRAVASPTKCHLSVFPQARQGQRAVARIAGIVLIVLGLALSLSALVSGPNAFGTGLGGVIVMVLAGVVCVMCGASILWRQRKK